jgi:transposase
MSTDGLNLPNDVEQLKAMVAGQLMVLAEREQLLVQHQAVVAEHTAALVERDALIVKHEAKIAQSEAVITTQHETIERQLKKVEGLEQQLARLLRRLHGPQQERIDPNQLLLFTAEELAEIARQMQQGTVDSVSPDDGSSGDATGAEPSTDGSSDSRNDGDGKNKKKGHGRRPIPAHIPREPVIHVLNDEERLCPCCGRLRKEIGREISEQLEFIPAQLKVLRHERVRYACETCEENVALAPKPPQPINKGLPGPGLLAYLALSKYGDYLPLYRLEDILSRSGILFRRSTLCGWVADVAALLRPLYDLMCHRVLRSHVIHTDDTGIKMLSRGQCQNCKFWTYVGDQVNPYVVYEFSLTREGKEPSRFLEHFKGYLQADAFSGYDQLYSKGHVIEVACMTHCRRYWWESINTDSRRAHEAVSYIARLYTLETQFEKALLTGNALSAARQQHALPILNDFEAWLRIERDQVLPKSPIGQAFTYTLNQWRALCRYTEDGALSIDNNLAERMVKLPAIGRGNWLFVGSEQGGHRAAILLSIIASAKYCQVEPWAWLTAVLTELPVRLAVNAATGPPERPPDLTDLLPDVWLKNHPENRWNIDDIRKVERERSKRQKAGKRGAKGR